MVECKCLYGGAKPEDIELELEVVGEGKVKAVKGKCKAKDFKNGRMKELIENTLGERTGR